MTVIPQVDKMRERAGQGDDSTDFDHLVSPCQEKKNNINQDRRVEQAAKKLTVDALPGLDQLVPYFIPFCFSSEQLSAT
ncbi:MAG: hypothetical protein A2521_05570 [Deltaproteobacteria bacterium RIFOXYD12_FULL_57_12]|nr:MAG: hypothetical protein A2521_05570 [Deltaproteobacteria bacterium RIFOXYD12_FULL_57_12]